MSVARVLAALALLAAPAAASASGLYVGDAGTRGAARAGAFIADPDTLLAIHYNPAGLSKLRGFHSEAQLTLGNAMYSFQRKCPCTDPNAMRLPLPGMPGDSATLDTMLEGTFTPVKNGYGFVVIPFLGISYGFEWMDLTIAAALYGPPGAAFEYGSRETGGDQPQRYSVIDLYGFEGYSSTGVAFSPLPGLRLGGTIHNVGVGLEQRIHTYANTVATPFAENKDFDIPATIEVSRFFGLNWSVGGTWEPIEELAIGASFTGKRSVRTEGTFESEVPEILTSAGINATGKRAEFELNLPPIFRWGVQLRQKGLGNLELAGVYEGWSVMKEIVIRPIDITLITPSDTMPLAKQRLIRDWQDTVSFRVGLDVEVLEPWVRLSAGYFYEPSAIPTSRLEPSTFDAPKHGVGLGAKTSWYGFTLDVGVETVFFASQVVSDSQVQQNASVEPPFGTRAWVTTIGNGTYSGSYLMIVSALSFSYDDFSKALAASSN